MSLPPKAPHAGFNSSPLFFIRAPYLKAHSLKITLETMYINVASWLHLWIMK